MKYIWMIMLGILEIVWTFCSIKDIYTITKECGWKGREYIGISFGPYTDLWLAVHIMGLFVYSLLTYLGVI